MALKFVKLEKKIQNLIYGATPIYAKENVET